MRKNKKILHRWQFIKRSFSKSNHRFFVLTLQEGSTDGCRLLNHPRPYNIYHFLLHRFILLKTFFSKEDKCKHVSSQLGKTNVSMHFFSPSLLFKTILPHCPGKRTAQKVDGYITLKICIIS